MKKVLSIFLSAAMLLLLLSACSPNQPPPATPNSDAAMLQFPKTNWNMGLQEVLDAYGVTADSVGIAIEDDQSACRIEGLTLFGVKTDYVLFLFRQDDGKLSHVRLTYPEDADMQTVRQQLQTLYGDSVKQHTRLVNGADDGDSYREETLEETERFSFWHSTTPISQYLSPEDWAAFQKLAQKKDTELNAGGAWRAYLENEPLVTLTWSIDASYPENLAVSDGELISIKNQVEFNASILHYLPELLSSAD